MTTIRFRCVCCGGEWGTRPAPCGHHFCLLCRGREHDEDCIECRAGRRPPATFNPLRDAVQRAIHDLDLEHTPVWSSDTARAVGKDPVGCETCYPRDGHWPCTTLAIINELRDALHGTGPDGAHRSDRA